VAIRRKLLRWYDLYQRDLPWRKTNDPYRIWISEVMLQQTRVGAMIPYYHNFLRRFPTMARLARSSEKELLACWSGLGYYSRARNLRNAAKIIVETHDGKFPREVETALALPGVGKYTAAAVLSIAYGRPLPVVDGNVARVLARLFVVAEHPKTNEGSKAMWRLASELLSVRRPGDFNQAMMELGATVCLPRDPECGRCPIQAHCRASLRGEVVRFPLTRAKPATILRRFVAAVARDNEGRVLLVRRRGDDKWLRGFWQLPMWEPNREPPPPGLALRELLGTVRHTITENRLEIAVFRASFRGGVREESRWLSLAEFRTFPVTTISRKALALGAVDKTLIAPVNA
jgi:A/G-specific adenine glycosylase